MFRDIHTMSRETNNLCRASNGRQHLRETDYECCDHETGEGGQQGKIFRVRIIRQREVLPKQCTHPRDPIAMTRKLA